MMDSNKITELAYRLLFCYSEVSKHFDLTSETIDHLSKRIQRIRAGLAPEMEFMAAVNWLSRVVGIHRLDQTPLPRYFDGYDVQQPDLLAIVHHKDRLLPVLIEVKTKNDKKLVWKEDYLQRFQRYAEIVNMPFLVAWKRWHIWSLVDAQHFEKKVSAYHLDFNTAMRQTLMSTLFGDLLVNVNERFQMFVDTESEETLPQFADMVPDMRYKMTIKNAGFMIDKKPVKVSKELSWIFHLAAVKDEFIRTGPSSVRIEFTPDSNNAFSLSHLWYSVATSGLKDKEPDWEEIMRNRLAIDAADVRRELNAGLEAGIIQHAASIVPNTMPDFLGGPDQDEATSVQE
jgi:Holliday junction resolvase